MKVSITLVFCSNQTRTRRRIGDGWLGMWKSAYNTSVIIIFQGVADRNLLNWC